MTAASRARDLVLSLRSQACRLSLHAQDSVLEAIAALRRQMTPEESTELDRFIAGRRPRVDMSPQFAIRFESRAALFSDLAKEREEEWVR